MSTTKELILEVSLDLFAENGYTETSIREIAKNVGIKPASIYNHFAAKTDILLCLLDQYKQNVLASITPFEEMDELIKSRPALEILHGLFFAFDSKNAEKMSKILKLIFHEQYRVLECRIYVKHTQFDFMIEYIAQVLKKLIDANMIRDIDPQVYSTMFVYIISSAAYRSMLYQFEEYHQVDRVRSRTALHEIFMQIVL